VDVFNVATGDYVTVREIAELACKCLSLVPGRTTRLAFGTGNRGWKGDVPVVRLSTARIRSLGWRCQRSTREALEASFMEMLPDLRAGRA
jgi:UDP-glucose 4-epimerase